MLLYFRMPWKAIPILSEILIVGISSMKSFETKRFNTNRYFPSTKLKRCEEVNKLTFQHFLDRVRLFLLLFGVLVLEVESFGLFAAQSPARWNKNRSCFYRVPISKALRWQIVEISAKHQDMKSGEHLDSSNLYRTKCLNFFLDLLQKWRDFLQNFLTLD